MKAFIPLAAVAAVLGLPTLSGVAVAEPAFPEGALSSMRYGSDGGDPGLFGGKFISCQNQSTFNLVDVPATLTAVATVVTPERILLGAVGPGPNDIDTTTVNAPSNNHCG